MLRVIVAVPDFELATSARKVLPTGITSDAALRGTFWFVYDGHLNRSFQMLGRRWRIVFISLTGRL